MANQAEARQMADNELLITRVFDAPVSLVFRIWEQREHMMRWLGPTGFVCTVLEMDFRAGGAWRACIESPEYGASWMSGQYREIERERRIVYTFAWEQSPRADVNLETLVTVTFAEQDGKTVQRFHQTPFTDVAARDSHIDGWTRCFDKEQAYLEQLVEGEQQ